MSYWILCSIDSLWSKLDEEKCWAFLIFGEEDGVIEFVHFSIYICSKIKYDIKFVIFYFEL
jgi:hypothetical protein